MSDINKQREYVQALYSGQRWKTKVGQMPDSQVVAIYLREMAKNAPPKPKPKESGQDEAPF